MKSGLSKASKKQTEETPDATLRNISLTLEDGKLLVVASILGETYLLSGTLQRKGRVAYVEQEPCIFSDSIRYNTLFGLPLD